MEEPISHRNVYARGKEGDKIKSFALNNQKMPNLIYVDPYVPRSLWLDHKEGVIYIHNKNKKGIHGTARDAPNVIGYRDVAAATPDLGGHEGKPEITGKSFGLQTRDLRQSFERYKITSEYVTVAKEAP